jgi:hypothetical protein
MTGWINFPLNFIFDKYTDSYIDTFMTRYDHESLIITFGMHSLSMWISNGALLAVYRRYLKLSRYIADFATQCAAEVFQIIILI